MLLEHILEVKLKGTWPLLSACEVREKNVVISSTLADLERNLGETISVVTID